MAVARFDWGLALAAFCVLDCTLLPLAPGLVPEALHDPVAVLAFGLTLWRAAHSVVNGHGAVPLGLFAYAAFFWLAANAFDGRWHEFSHALGSLSLAAANLSACRGCRHATTAVTAEA